MPSADSRRLLLIAALVTLIPAIAVVCSHHISCSYEQHQTQQSTTQEHTACELVLTSYTDAFPREQTAKTNQGQGGNDAPRAAVLLLLNLIWKTLHDPIALITGVLALYTYRLWRATITLAEETKVSSDRQFEQTKRALYIAKRSVQAADRTAEAAKDTLWATKDVARNQLRAYVCIDGAKVSFENPAFPKAFVRIANRGQTPAYNVRAWIHMWIEAHPLTVDLPAPHASFGSTDSMMAPDQDTTLVANRPNPIPPEAMHLVGTPLGTIYVYGRVEYRDIFKEDRWINFRLIHGGSEPMDLDDEGMKVDSAGNDTSES